MGRHGSALVGVIAVIAMVMAAPALAHARSLAISLPGSATTGKPLSLTISGLADGGHRLFAYADQSGYACAASPSGEISSRSGLATLSSADGDALAAGSYSKLYTFTPATLSFRICAYLDATASGTPDVSTSASIEDPVNKYLENQEEAQPTGSGTGTLPGAIEPAPYSPQIAKEYWERIAREAQTRQEREHAEHEALQAERSIAAPCVVPALRGYSLRRAKRVLTRSHCKLGRVRVRRSAHHKLVVTQQGRARNTKLRNGAPVAVTLGA